MGPDEAVGIDASDDPGLLEDRVTPGLQTVGSGDRLSITNRVLSLDLELLSDAAEPYSLGKIGETDVAHRDDGQSQDADHHRVAFEDLPRPLELRQADLRSRLLSCRSPLSGKQVHLN